MRSSKQQNLPVMEVNRVDRERSTLVNSVHHAQSTAVQKVDPDRDWLSLVDRARGKALMQHKALASNLGIGEGLLSAQIACAPNKHLSFRRMRNAGRDFWQELVLLIIDFYDLQIGITEQDRRDLELGRTLREAVQRSVAR